MSRRPAAGDTILVVGDVIDDIVVRPEHPPVPDADTPSEITACFGGSAANQAAWLGTLGVPVRFAGRVGTGDAARHTAALRACGVDARLAADPSTPTGQIVVLAVDGRRDMYTNRGANLNLRPADLPDTLLDDVTLLHVTGYTLFHPGPRAAITTLMTRARERGIPLSTDPSSATHLTPPTDYLTHTQGARLIFPNLTEAHLLAAPPPASPPPAPAQSTAGPPATHRRPTTLSPAPGPAETPEPAATIADDPESARALAEAPKSTATPATPPGLRGTLDEAYAVADVLVRTYEVVALKLGPAGALLATADGLRLHHRAPASGVVDPTGAGDAFCAGFLASWTGGRDLATCLTGAQQAAATALTTAGARPRIRSPR